MLQRRRVTSERLRPIECCPSTQKSQQIQASVYSTVNTGKNRHWRSDTEEPDRLRHLHFRRQPTVLPIRQRAFQQSFAETAPRQKLL